MACLLRAGIGSEEEVTEDSKPDALGGNTRFGKATLNLDSIFAVSLFVSKGLSPN